jgi:hypothetical protein
MVDPGFRFLEGPVTLTLVTAPGSTVIVAVPCTPPTLAVIVAVPAFDVVTFAVVVPVDCGSAICASSEVQVTVLLVTALPIASVTVAVKLTVWPAVTLELEGLIVTETIGGGPTVTVDEPVLPPLVASMVVLPTATAVTTPVLGSTVAIAGSFDDQATVGLGTVAPVTSTTVALNDPVCPWVSESVGGLTVTDCTGGGVTVMADVPVAAPLFAEMVAVPAATPVTTPACETVATRASLVLHVTGRFVSTVPLASVSVAVSVAV